MPSIDITPSQSRPVTIPQPMFERIQNEWRQMRVQASEQRPAAAAEKSIRD